MESRSPSTETNLHNVELRLAKAEDLPEIKELFVDTVRSVCSKDYTNKQLAVWTSSIENEERWLNKIKTQYFLVAKRGSNIVGFASLENGDYIDLLYVHKDFQNHGIANALLSSLQMESFRQGTRILRSDVSKTARPFFERKGFRQLREHTRIIDGVAINNFEMEKLNP